MKVEVKKVRFAVPGGVVHGHDGKEYKCTHIECQVRYTLGGYSYWDGQRYPRGYYAHVTPIEVEDCWVRCTIGSGAKFLLLECGRQTAKREAEAVAKFDANIRDYVARLYDVTGIDMAAA